MITDACVEIDGHVYGALTHFLFSDISNAMSYAVVVLSLPELPSALECDRDRIIFTKVRLGGYRLDSAKCVLIFNSEYPVCCLEERTEEI